MTGRLGKFPCAHRRDNRPKLAIIGGRLEDDNASIYDEMHRLAGGRIVVFATASSVPEEVGAETVGVFRDYGFDAVLAGVHGAGAPAAAQDQAIADLVEDYGSVYFTGGDQALITAALARSSISREARRVKVNNKILAGSTPCSTRYAVRKTSTRVLPLPAPAINRYGPCVDCTASS